MNSVKTLLWIVEVLSNFNPKLDNSKAHSTILPVASGLCKIDVFQVLALPPY